jgi:hypothetical protein
MTGSTKICFHGMDDFRDARSANLASDRIRLSGELRRDTMFTRTLANAL